MFDGVHLGHQQVIRQTVADGRQHEAAAVVVTFDRHPNAVVKPSAVPPLIYSLPQKLRAISDLGADLTLLVPFTHEFSRQPGEAFIRSLAADFGSIVSISVGAAFTFGHKRTGNVALLTELGKELKFKVHSSPSVALDGEVVSSTRIRQVIQKGDLDGAAQMLGRPYSLAAKIVKGAQRGRALGFPTANLDCAGLVLPPLGVYAAHAVVKSRQYRAVVNLGLRPTVEQDAPVPQVEAHLLDFNGDLYGQEMDLTFVHWLRPERAFPNIAALAAQIAQDVQAARAFFG